jgi:hypothetical protein
VPAEKQIPFEDDRKKGKNNGPRWVDSSAGLLVLALGGVGV